jgi:hypothetical protein
VPSNSREAEERVRRVTLAILLIGLASAVVIWLVNAPTPAASGFALEDSKKYLRDVEVVGGTANLVATDFRHWLDGLWHGRTLAFTVAVLSALLALAWDFLAMPMPVEGDAAAGPKKSGAKPGA